MKFIHTNIIAKDWKRLSQFYIDVFDCTPKPPERHLSGNWLDQATGLTDAKLHGIHLILPGYGPEHKMDGPTLEIFSYESMDTGSPIPANHTGFGHIAFLVDDVKKIYEKALEHGGQALGEVTQKEIEGVGKLTLIYFRDPEGNIVEIQSWE